MLDVGSGRGTFCANMAASGLRSFGVEPNPAYLAEARARANERGVQVSLTQGGGERLPFPNASFDFVNCSEVTEHVNDPVRVCREVGRVLKKGARAYISFHNRFGIYDYHYHFWCINWMPRSWGEALLSVLNRQKEDSPQIGRQKLSSMHYYTFARANALLVSLGFSVSDIRESKIQSRFPQLCLLLFPFYRILLRPLYFNTFHLLVQKL